MMNPLRINIRVNRCCMFVLLLCVLLAMGFNPAHAQDLDCEMGQKPVGYLGISGIECHCTHFTGSDSEQEMWSFQSEPTILEIDGKGPAADKLKKGDVLIALNGTLITTQKGGLLFSNPEPGNPIEVLVRRGEQINAYRLVPFSICPEDRRNQLTVESHALQTWVESLKSLETLSVLESDKSFNSLKEDNTSDPRGWLGLGLSCSGCCIETSIAGPMKWHFSEPPTIYSVEDNSPSGDAGLRKNDVVTHIDGIQLDSIEGGKLFANIKPGQEIRWTILRNGREMLVKTFAESPPSEQLPHHWITDTKTWDIKKRLRYTGTLGNTGIEVRGSKPVIVSVNETQGEVVIDTGDTTIRIKSKK